MSVTSESSSLDYDPLVRAPDEVRIAELTQAVHSLGAMLKSEQAMTAELQSRLSQVQDTRGTAELRAQMLHMAMEFAARLNINGTDQIIRLADRMYDYVANGEVPSE